ncbi:unnamed protein product [Heterobilharzia americana]|nr:unnamed protein product [Heterobilharzia americana]CAH8667318.1 unnamed protein product [Heterobilharzia americana]
MNILLILSLYCLNSGLSDKKVGLEVFDSENVPVFDIKKEKFFLAGVLNKTWDGPYHYDGLIGSMLTIPCVTSSNGINRVNVVRSNAVEKRKAWAVLWVHQLWTNVIDPWLGDGRRSYDPLEVNQWSPHNIQSSISQSRLAIVDTDATDTGVYACIMVTYPIEDGYSPVYLKQAELMSIHFVRIHSNLVVAPGCNELDESEENHCKSGFEQWTFNVYYPTSGWTGDILFQAPCNADLFLTALSMSGVDPTFWSVGWQFIPYGQIDNSKVVETGSDSDIKWIHPVHICLDGSPVPCPLSSEFLDNVTKVNGYDLSSAHIRASNHWRARWLALTDSVQQYSGSWQCWIQGLAITSHSVTTPFPVRWLTNEVHVRIIPRKYMWTTIQLWRVVALIMGPLNILLIFIIFAVGWYSAYNYRNKMKQSTTPFNVKKKFSFTQQHLDDYENAEQQQLLQTPANYLDQFLQKSGIRSYQEYYLSKKD